VTVPIASRYTPRSPARAVAIVIMMGGGVLGALFLAAA
jgi:hypothetical protein